MGDFRGVGDFVLDFASFDGVDGPLVFDEVESLDGEDDDDTNNSGSGASVTLHDLTGVDAPSLPSTSPPINPESLDVTHATTTEVAATVDEAPFISTLLSLLSTQSWVAGMRSGSTQRESVVGDGPRSADEFTGSELNTN